MDEDLDNIEDIDIDELIKRSTEEDIDPAHEDRMVDGIIAEQRRAAEEAEAERNRVRKIKVKKMVKRPVSAPISDGEQQVSFEEEDLAHKTVGNNFDLDKYLDEEEAEAAEEDNVSLPTVTDNPVTEEAQPRFINESDIIKEKPTGIAAILEGEAIPRKKALIAVLVVFFVGFFFAKMFFTEQKVVQHGLQGVVPNVEVPKGRARCGLAERAQGCVLYIMNPQRQELNARDFYDLAAQLTGRQRFVIETSNMRYAGIKIRPGELAQLNIPPLQ
jgi:hypothetical protein